ncbi:hypothetical protein [Devosia sp. 2618]|uniref:hypothetical protein n=1 Tax=Devosia sp. 2618 TaxID=3156454 RepID=UPI003395C0BA
MKTLIAIGILTLATIAPAMAACPPEARGDTAETIAANQQRLICLNQEISTSARQKQFEMQLQNNQTAIQDLQLQRRLDSLPKRPVFTPVVPTYNPGN